jgi:hypothetical protein
MNSLTPQTRDFLREMKDPEAEKDFFVSEGVLVSFSQGS